MFGCKSSHNWGTQWRFKAISVQKTRVSVAFQGCCDRALAPNPPMGSSLRHSGDVSWSDRWWRKWPRVIGLGFGKLPLRLTSLDLLSLLRDNSLETEDIRQKAYIRVQSTAKGDVEKSSNPPSNLVTRPRICPYLKSNRFSCSISTGLAAASAMFFIHWCHHLSACFIHPTWHLRKTIPSSSSPADIEWRQHGQETLLKLQLSARSADRKAHSPGQLGVPTGTLKKRMQIPSGNLHNYGKWTL